MYILCHEVGPRLLWRLTLHDDHHSRCPSKNEEDQGQVSREHLEELLTAALSLTSSWECARFSLPCQGQACWSISSTMFCSISSRWYIHIDDCSALSIDLLMIRKPTGSPVDDQELALKQNKWGFVDVISCRKIYYFSLFQCPGYQLVIAKLTGKRLEREHTRIFLCTPRPRQRSFQRRSHPCRWVDSTFWCYF